MNKKESLAVIASAITLRFANAGIMDNIDLMRCNIFGMDVARLTEEQNGCASFDSIKSCKGYAGLPVNITDGCLQDIIEQAEFIYNHADGI